MGGNIQSVTLEGTVYVGGGIAEFGSCTNCIVKAYDTYQEEWLELLPYRAFNFTMVIIENELVLVGGVENGEKLNVLGVWNVDNEQWLHPYQNMPTARSECSAVVCREWLVVAGGIGESGDRLSSLELMNIETDVWYTGPSTPVAWSSMRTAVVGDTCYFIGGYIDNSDSVTDLVYMLSLPCDFLSTGIKWEVLHGLQSNRSAPLSINGSLFAVGGEERGRPLNAIHLYQPITGKWVKVGEVPTPRTNFTCTMIEASKFLVIGGRDTNMMYDHTLLQMKID